MFVYVSHGTQRLTQYIPHTDIRIHFQRLQILQLASRVAKGEKLSGVTNIISAFNDFFNQFNSFGVWKTIVIEFLSPLEIEFGCSHAYKYALSLLQAQRFIS